MTAKDKLVEELKKLDLFDYDNYQYEEIADFILEDRKRILEPLIKTDFEPVHNLTAIGLCDRYAQAIREVIKLSQVEGD